MLQKKTVLIFYPYFLPGYKAGGPIQSLANMIATLSSDYNFAIVTTPYDLNETSPYANINLNAWNELIIGNCKAKVWYADVGFGFKTLRKLFEYVKPDFVFINGMYGFSFFLLPLLIKNLLRKNYPIKFIISPRGMLQAGALALKSRKKKLYIQLLKTTGLFKNSKWHCTTDDEASDVKKIIHNTAITVVAGNIPKQPVETIIYPSKIKGVLRLVYLSIIAEKKNLLLLINILKKANAIIVLHIYGPVKDKVYWQQCLQAMNEVPANVTIEYKGDIEPNLVQQTLMQYDAKILLTMGENFGHALYESLSVARPLITSYYTPWNNLEQQNAGWNVDINNINNIISLLNKLAEYDEKSWQLFCNGAFKMANNYFQQGNFKQAYGNLFS